MKDNKIYSYGWTDPNATYKAEAYEPLRQTWLELILSNPHPIIGVIVVVAWFGLLISERI